MWHLVGCWNLVDFIGGHRFLLNDCHFSWVLRHPPGGITPLFLNQGVYNTYVYIYIYMFIHVYSYKQIIARIDFYGFNFKSHTCFPSHLTLSPSILLLIAPSHRVVSLSFSGSSWGLPTRLPFTKRLKVWRFGPQESQGNKNTLKGTNISHLKAAW